MFPSQEFRSLPGSRPRSHGGCLDVTGRSFSPQPGDVAMCPTPFKTAAPASLEVRGASRGNNGNSGTPRCANGETTIATRPTAVLSAPSWIAADPPLRDGEPAAVAQFRFSRSGKRIEKRRGQIMGLCRLSAQILRNLTRHAPSQSATFARHVCSVLLPAFVTSRPPKGR